MSQTNFKIDIAKISFELKKANPDFMKKHLDKITGKSYRYIRVKFKAINSQI